MAFFAARQPILNNKKELVAYELLFRQSLDNVFPKIDPDQATAHMVEGLHLNMGLDSLADDKLAFINFTHDSLLHRYPLLLPKEQVVVELLETVRPTKGILQACEELKQKGYTLALDDYEHAPVWKHFFPLIDIIKIDFSLTSFEQMQELMDICKPYPHIQFLAEKVETYEDFSRAQKMGFSLYQGYFFSKPEVVQNPQLTPSQVTIVQLLSEINSGEPDMQKVCAIFERDVSLSYKLLRFVQSPLFVRPAKVSSIKQAIIQLGQKELAKFVALLFAVQFKSDKPQPLTALSLERARFCELVAIKAPRVGEPAEAFLVGMLSLLDAMLDAELKALLEKLPLNQSIIDALSNHQGALADVLDLCEAIQSSDWQQTDALAQSMGLSNSQVEDIAEEARLWGEKMAEFE